VPPSGTVASITTATGALSPSEPTTTASGWTWRRRAVLVLLTVLALARGGYWALTTEVWSPIDEAQHYAYVESLATGQGIPTVGRDLVSGHVTALAKTSETFLFRGRDVSVEPDDPGWGPFNDQYEGVQGPVYYALMTPFFWAGRPFGVLTSVFVVRMGSVLLGALALPLAALLARRLFPGRASIAVLAPLLLLVVNGFNGTTGAIGNDTLVLTGSALALWLFLRAGGTASRTSAAVAGIVAGAVLVGKTTAVGLFGLGALALVLDPIWRRRPLYDRLRWCGWFAAATVAAVAPWVAWNVHAYGAISGAEQAELLTGAAQETFPRNLDTLVRQLDAARSNFWESQLTPFSAVYPAVWYVALIGFGVAGIVVASTRGRGSRALGMGWLGAAFPMAFVGVVGVFFVFFEEAGLVRGRYLYGALVPLVVLLAAGIVEVVGARWAPAAALGVATVALQAETALVDRYVTLSYEFGLFFLDEGTYAPVIDQSWNDGFVTARAITADAGCPVRFVGAGLADAPETLAVRPSRTVAGGPAPDDRADSPAVTATRFTVQPNDVTVYALAQPIDGPLLIEVPGDTTVATSTRERAPGAGLVGADGDPVVRVYCLVEGAESRRFEERFDPQHISALTRPVVRGWPRAWALAGAGATAGAVVAALRQRRELRDRPGTTPPEQ